MRIIYGNAPLIYGNIQLNGPCLLHRHYAASRPSPKRGAASSSLGLERLLLVRLTESTSGLAKGYYEYQAQARPRGRTIVFGGSWTLPIPEQEAPTL